MQSFPGLVTKRSGSRYKANAEMLLRTDADDQRQTREHQQKNSTATQGAAEREPFDQSGGWESFPNKQQGDFR